MARNTWYDGAASGDPVDPRTGTPLRKQAITRERKRYGQSWRGRIHSALARFMAFCLAPRSNYQVLPEWRERLLWLCAIEARMPGMARRLLSHERQVQKYRSYYLPTQTSRLGPLWERWSPCYRTEDGRLALLAPRAYWRLLRRRLNWLSQPILTAPKWGTRRPTKRWRVVETFLPELKGGGADG